MQHGVPRSSPTPSTEPRAADGQEPGPPTATTEPATTEPASTEPASTEPASTEPASTTVPITTATTATTSTTSTTATTSTTSATSVPTTTVVGVVDVAGPPVPALVQQFGVGASGSSSAASNATAVVAAKGPLPSQALPATGAASIETAGVAALLLVAGLLAVRASRASHVTRRRPVDAI